MDDFNPNFKKDSNELVELFGKGAEKWAKNMKNDILTWKNKEGKKIPNKKGVSTTQFRKFYEKVLELDNKAQGLSDEKFKIKVLPFLKMLNSKVQYAKTRELVGNDFVNLFQKSIDNINSAPELQNFKYFLEAIIGYMPKK